MSFRPALLSSFSLLAMISCSVATDVGKPGVSVLGNWQYAGQRTSPTDAELTGTLAITTEEGGAIGGALDVVETDSRGVQRRIAGVVAGRTLHPTTIDFDVTVSGVMRRHVGQVRGDSVTGSWVEQPAAGGAPIGSGTFRGKRLR